MKRKFIAAFFLAAALMTGCVPVDESEDVIEHITHAPPEGGYGGRYVYSAMTDSEKADYDVLLGAVRTFRPEAVFASPLSEDELRKIFTAVYMQESRVFWLDSRYYSAGENPSVSLFYRYDSAQSEKMRAELDVAAGKIIGGLADDCTDYEAVRHFHDQIIQGAEFSKEGDYVHTAYGALVEGHAQCEGYAFAFKYLCDMAGIDCYVVSGQNSEGAAHAWNKVCVDGEWYNADCTWDDPVLNREAPDYIRHDFMLVPDSDINGVTHFPDERYIEHIPCESEDQNYFVKEGLYFSSASEGIAALEEQIRKAASAGKREAEVRFSSHGECSAAASRLFDEGGLKTIVERLNGNYGTDIVSAKKSINDTMDIIHLSLIFKGDKPDP